jgi:putative copper export protein
MRYFKISPYILFRTSYGSVFLLKLAIFVVVVFFSYMHDFVWGPKSVEVAREGKNAENIRKRVILIPRFTLLLGVFMVLLGAILWAGGV